MKNIAYGLLLVIFLAVLIEPLVDIANVLREKIMIGSALSGACRAAKDRSLLYERQRDRDAEVDGDKFKDYFAEAFSDALNLTRTSDVGDTMTFTSDDGKFSSFTVTVNIEGDTDLVSRQTVTRVKVRAESPYKFKTKYLKLAVSAGEGPDYLLTSERMILLRVRN